MEFMLLQHERCWEYNGRVKSILNSRIKRKIKTCVLQGQSIKEIAQNIGISENTLRDWFYRDTHKIAKDIRLWKAEAMLKEAEKISKEILTLDLRKEDGTLDPQILKVQQKEASFLREKLVIARQHYSNSSKISKEHTARVPMPILGDLEVV